MILKNWWFNGIHLTDSTGSKVSFSSDKGELSFLMTAPIFKMVYDSGLLDQDATRFCNLTLDYDMNLIAIQKL